LAYSPDGRYLLAAIGDYLEVRDAKSHTLLHEQHRHENTIGRIAISADSGRVATISDDLTVRISALTSQGDERILLGHRSRATAVAFSQDGRRLATGAENGTVRVWDVTTGQELLTLSEIGGDNFRIWDLVFRDERTLQAVGVNRERDASFLAEWRAE
jgi:WD40 repeat protein